MTATAAPTRREVVLDVAPRKVSLRASAATLAGTGAGKVICWLWLLLSSLTWFISAQSEVVTLVEFAFGHVVADGDVLGVNETSVTENDEPVLGTDYVYEFQGQRYEGTSYGVDAPYEPGAQVAVEVVSYRPERSRIRGMRARAFGVVGALALFAPLMAFVLVGGVVRSGLEELRLLRRGVVGHGKLSSKRAISEKVNAATMYELTFEFEAAPPAPPEGGSAYGQPAPTPRAHHVTLETTDTSRLTDEAEEPLLYDPHDPSNATMVDGLPPGLVLAGDVGGGGLGVPLLAIAGVVLHIVVLLLAL